MHVCKISQRLEQIPSGAHISSAGAISQCVKTTTTKKQNKKIWLTVAFFSSKVKHRSYIQVLCTHHSKLSCSQVKAWKVQGKIT